MLEAVRTDGLLLRYGSPVIQADKAVVMEAVRNHGVSIQYASTGLQKDTDVLAQIVRFSEEAFAVGGDAYKATATEAVRFKGGTLAYVHRSLREEKDLVTLAVGQDGLALQYASDKLRKDIDVVTVAVRQNGMALEHGHETMRQKEAVVREAVKADGNALQHAHESMKRNLGVVKLAVAAIVDHNTNQVAAVTTSARPAALRYADEQMRKNKGVVLAALRRQLNDGADPALIYGLAHDDLRSNKEFLKEALMSSTGTQQRHPSLWATFRPELRDPHHPEPFVLEFAKDSIVTSEEGGYPGALWLDLTLDALAAEVKRKEGNPRRIYEVAEACQRRAGVPSNDLLSRNEDFLAPAAKIDRSALDFAAGSFRQNAEAWARVQAAATRAPTESETTK